MVGPIINDLLIIDRHTNAVVTRGGESPRTRGGSRHGARPSRRIGVRTNARGRRRVAPIKVNLCVHTGYRCAGKIYVIPIRRAQAADSTDRHRGWRAHAAGTVIVRRARAEGPRSGTYIVKRNAIRRTGRTGDDHAILEKFHQRNGAVKIAGLCGQRQETRRRNTSAH